MSLNKDMGNAHEAHLVDRLAMRPTRGSGNQWRDPIDARHNRQLTEYAFAVDGKSTLAKSISVSRAMWEKAVDQAGGERPMIALRYYDNASLKVAHDLAVCTLDDFAELLRAARLFEQVLPHLRDMATGAPIEVRTSLDDLKRIYREATEA